MKEITIDGSKITDIKSFYEEINLVFMHNEDWKLGESLDAFNDLFYGGFGALNGQKSIQLTWKNIEQSRNALGLQTTLDFYQSKLKSPKIYNIEFISQKIEELKSGNGSTYFEIILQIISEHPEIKLVEK